MISIVLSGLIVLITHTLEAVTGFGCTVLALPFVSALLGVRQAVRVLTALAWLLAVYIAIKKRKNIDFRHYLIISACMLVGLPLGLYLFRFADTGFLKTLLAIFIVLSSALQLLKLSGFLKIGKPLPKPLAVLLLVSAGVVHGMFASGGPLVVLYASVALPDKGRFRATLCLLWATLNTILLSTYILGGAFDTHTVGLVGWMIPFLLAGIVAGEKVHDRVQARTFSFIVFGMLFCTGLFMLMFK